MATNNRNWDNQSQSSNQGWDQNRDRYNQHDDYRNRDHYSNTGSNYAQNENMRGDYGSTGYGDMNYGRDMDNNRSGNMNSGYGNEYGNRQQTGSQFGDRNSNYTSRDWSSGSYNNQYDHNNQDRNQWQNTGSWGTNDRNDRNMGYGNNQGAQYGGGYNNDRYNTGGGYTGSGGYISNQGNNRGGNDYGRGNYNNDRNYNNSGQLHNNDRDRDWWDRTKDEVSSWFNSDDNNRNSGPHRGKGPKDYHRSDDRIREDVCDRLSDDTRVDASDINVQIQNNEVILSGTVNSKEEKRRAEDIVESVSGVRNVENRLKVGHHDDSTSSTMSGSTRTTGSETTTNERSKNKS